MANFPSIFNDVIGPVMRGPSSSHCAAALRIGRICRDLMENEIEEISIKFDPNGSLATTHESQGSDMGLVGGLMGWEADDERLPNYKDEIGKAGIKINIEICEIGAPHPNTYQIILKNRKETRSVTAISSGGGMIEIIEIDGAKVSIAGDYFETFVYTNAPDNIIRFFKEAFEYDELIIHNNKIKIIEVKSQNFPKENLLAELHSLKEVLFVKKISPVLPILSRKNLQVPFISCKEMLEYNDDRNLQLWQLAVEYESIRGNISHQEVFSKMNAIVKIMKNSINEGLKGTEYKDRILGAQSVTFKEKDEDRALIDAGVVNKIIMYVSAILEVKSSMGVIVAAPTAGSCGALPGAVIAVAESLGLTDEEITKAMLASGMIGVFIAAHATFAAEIGGCMAECGSGSGMAAAAIVGLVNGSLDQSLSSASLALQNSFGMVCDPIANRVEAPCLGKNVMAATNALSCANMALANYNHLIPLDEVIEAMDKIGKSISHELRCTGLGGLSITKTSKEIENKLSGKWVN